MGAGRFKSMMMTVVLHAATALSTLVVFRKDVGYFRGLFLSSGMNRVGGAKIIISNTSSHHWRDSQRSD